MLFGICTYTSRMPKFWHMYLITYGDFVIIVEPIYILQAMIIVDHHERDYDDQAFLQALFTAMNVSKKSILNWIMRLISLCVFFTLLFSKQPWTIFYSFHLFFLLFALDTYKHIKESYMYLSSQCFFKTPHKALNFQEKSKKQAFSSNLQRPKFHIFLSVSTIGPPQGATELSKQ